MAKFITGTELEDAIRNIIWDAKETLLIVSPFIKLDDFFTEHFKRHKDNSRLHILIVFGKNEYDKSKSLNRNDFDFFTSFPNVSIIYVPNLHAKYYANESKGVITSINLYDHAFKNNIEYGVFSENNLLNKLTHSADQGAWEKSMEVANSGDPIFIKRPIFKRKMLGLLGKDYVSSKILLDYTGQLYNYSYTKSGKKLVDFDDDLDYETDRNEKPTREQFAGQVNDSGAQNSHYAKKPLQFSAAKMGFCIRTGVQIPFNLDKPLSEQAYRSWSQYGNPDYSENFCHFSGEPSNGETSYNRPVLKRYWRKAQES